MATTAKPTPSWRDILPIHPAARLLPPMSDDELRVLGQDIRKHGLHEPVTLQVCEGVLVLIDGINRLDAMEREGFALVQDGKLDKTLGHKALGLEPLTGGAYAELDSDVDPYAFVISANINRRHLTAKQRRGLINVLLKADPSKSDREIGRIIKADHKTVGAVRAEQEATGEISPVEKRVGKDRKARKQPSRKPHNRREQEDVGNLTRPTTLVECWRKRMVAPWEMASRDEQQKFVDGLRENQRERAARNDAIAPNSPVSEAANGEEVDVDAAILGDLLKAWDRAPEPVREKFKARVGLVCDPLAIPPFLDRRTREARS
jgi:hypothetical protein